MYVRETERVCSVCPSVRAARAFYSLEDVVPLSWPVLWHNKSHLLGTTAQGVIPTVHSFLLTTISGFGPAFHVAARTVRVLEHGGYYTCIIITDDPKPSARCLKAADRMLSIIN